MAHDGASNPIFFPRDPSYFDMSDSRQNDGYDSYNNMLDADINQDFADLAHATYDSYAAQAAYSSIEQSFYSQTPQFVYGPKDNTHLLPQRYEQSASPSMSMSQSLDHAPSSLSHASGASGQSTASSAVGSPFSQATQSLPGHEHWVDHRGLGIASGIVNEAFLLDQFALSGQDTEHLGYTNDKFPGSYVGELRRVSSSRVSCSPVISSPLSYSSHMSNPVASSSFSSPTLALDTSMGHAPDDHRYHPRGGQQRDGDLDEDAISRGDCLSSRDVARHASSRHHGELPHTHSNTLQVADHSSVGDAFCRTACANAAQGRVAEALLPLIRRFRQPKRPHIRQTAHSASKTHRPCLRVSFSDSFLWSEQWQIRCSSRVNLLVFLALFSLSIFEYSIWILSLSLSLSTLFFRSALASGYVLTWVDLDPALIQAYDTSAAHTAPAATYTSNFQPFQASPHMFQPPSPAPSDVSSHGSYRFGTVKVQSGNASPYLYQQYPQTSQIRRPSMSSSHSYYSHDSPRSSVGPDGDGAERGRCPNLDCGRLFKDLKAHMLTHQSERPEKCPIVTCEYHQKGFARKYDKNRHTLTHYKGTMVCGFCPHSGQAAEKSFNRADVFKRHLTSVHGVEQNPPNSRKKSPGLTSAKKSTAATNEAAGKCSTCSTKFSNAQELYDHIDACLLTALGREDPCEAINERCLTAVANDRAVRETMERLLPAGLTHSSQEDDEDEEEDEEEDERDTTMTGLGSSQSRSGKGAIKSKRDSS